MHIQDVRYFIEVAECGSITAAAEKLYMSYYGLYKGLARLEDELGMPLFDRDYAGVRLSEYGKYVKEHFAVSFLHYADGLSDSARAFETYVSNHLRISLPMTSTNLHWDILDICNSFKERHTDADIEFIQQPLIAGRHALEAGDIDAAIAYGDDGDTEKYESVPAFHRVYKVAVNSAHPFASRARLTFADLYDQQVMISFRFNYATDYLIHHAGVPESHVLILPVYEQLATGLLENNSAIAVVPFDGGRAVLNYKDAVFIPFSPDFCVDIVLLYRKALSQKVLLADFADYFSREMASRLALREAGVRGSVSG